MERAKRLCCEMTCSKRTAKRKFFRFMRKNLKRYLETSGIKKNGKYLVK